MVAVALSPKSQTREAKTLPLSNVLVSVNVQSSEVQVAVNFACGPAPLGGAVTVNCCVTAFVRPAVSLTVRLTL